MRLTVEIRPGFRRRFLWAPRIGQVSVRLYGARWLGLSWSWR